MDPNDIAEFGHLWEEDARLLVPDFELFDLAAMLAEIDRVRDLYGETEATMTDLQTVVRVLRNLDEGTTNVPPAWWWIEASLLILPDMDCQPWFQVMWWIYEGSRGKRKVNTIWGSASSSKSSSFAAMVIVTMAVWHGGAHAYITCPYKNSAEDKIFREITKRADIWAEKPPVWALELEISVRSVKNTVEFVDSEKLTSACILVSLETTASVQGKKRDVFNFPWGYDPKTGAIILIGDELIINPAACNEYQDGSGNLVSNNNFMGFVGMNPLPHQVKHPNAIKLSAPVDRPMESMDENKDFTWETALGSLYRLCMANSPNRFRRSPVFPYLINEEQAEASSRGGDLTRKAQVAAWGWSGGVGNGGVLTLDAVTNPNVQAEPVWHDATRSRWVFFDLAFGGNDPAGYCAFQSGLALINGQQVAVVSTVEQETFHVEKRWTPTADDITEFTRLAESYGGRAPMLQSGVEMESHACIVLQMLRVSSRLGIPKGRVSFDSSLRPDVTTMAREALGHVPWYYDGTRALSDDEGMWPLYPPEYKVGPDGRQDLPKKWSDNHRRVISAAWRHTEHIIFEGHLHNLRACSKGTQELLARPWVSTGNKADLLSKKELGKSPMYAETLALGLVFGVRFAGALPQLAKRVPITIGGGASSAVAEDLFKLRSVRPSRRMWA